MSAASDVGKVREINEDSYCDIVHPEFSAMRLTVVADGMGGHRAGEVASKLATDFLCKRFERLLDLAQPEEWLAESIQAANDAIVNHAMLGAEVAGMGTTLTAALIIDRREGAGTLPVSIPVPEGELVLTYGHVGDSRMYLYRDETDELVRITDDHSLVGELLRNGDLTEEEAQHHPQRNYLTQALGTRELLDVDSGQYTLKPGDAVVLCTDGLSNLVSTAELLHELHQSGFGGAAGRLKDLALARGGQDNITVVLIQA